MTELVRSVTPAVTEVTVTMLTGVGGVLVVVVEDDGDGLGGKEATVDDVVGTVGGGAVPLGARVDSTAVT